MMSASKNPRKRLSELVQGFIDEQTDEGEGDSAGIPTPPVLAPIANRMGEVAIATIQRDREELERQKKEFERDRADLARAREQHEQLRRDVESARLDGRLAVELDTTLIDDSPYRDRADWGFEGESFERLVRTIGQEGQLVPIAVRRKPDNGERYEIIWGHRRVRACRRLGIMVRAVVREVDTRNLALLMDLENTQRENLSTIERARKYRKLIEDGVFATQNEMAMHFQMSEGHASKLLLVAGLPDVIVQALGDPGRVSYRQWLRLANGLKSTDALKAAEAAAEAVANGPVSFDAKIAALLDAGQGAPKARESQVLHAHDGSVIGAARRSRRGRVSLELEGTVDPVFLDFLLERMASLYADFLRGRDGT
jgi:ParB family transcriptional regulator, chromosome partitioning protein